MKPILMVKIPNSPTKLKAEQLQIFWSVMKKIFADKYDLVAVPNDAKVYPENNMSIHLTIDENVDMVRLADDLKTMAEEAYIPEINNKPTPGRCDEVTMDDVRKVLAFLSDNGFDTEDLLIEVENSPFGKEE